MCNCNNVYNTAAVICDGTDLILVIPTEFEEPQNRQVFNFRICQKIPSAGECLKVSINISGTSYPLWNKYGSPAFGNEIACGRVFYGYYDLGHFISADLPVSCCGGCRR